LGGSAGGTIGGAIGAMADDTYLDNRQCLACDFTFREANEDAAVSSTTSPITS
jgi:hypothetical protein